MEIFAIPRNATNKAEKSNFDFIVFVLGAFTHIIDLTMISRFNDPRALTVHFDALA